MTDVVYRHPRAANQAIEQGSEKNSEGMGRAVRRGDRSGRAHSQSFGEHDVVYARLAPGVLDELKQVMPKDEKAGIKGRYFQLLTKNLGYPKLREHLGSVVTR